MRTPSSYRRTGVKHKSHQIIGRAGSAPRRPKVACVVWNLELANEGFSGSPSRDKRSRLLPPREAKLTPLFLLPARRACRWDDHRTAPLATPETLSEASTSSPPSPVVPAPRPMRRTPKIPGNLSTAADDLKNNLHYAMLSAKNYFLRGSAGEHAGGSNNGSSSGNSEASYESARSLAAAGLPPPVPRRRDSVTVRREQRTCTAACCRDDLSENSSSHTSSHSSRVSRTSHRVQVEFNEEENDTNGSSLDFYEAKGSSGQRDSSNDVFLSVRSSPECKGLMAPATDLGAEWKKGIDAAGVGDAALPLLRGLSPTPTPGQHNSPFFNAKRKKYVYPITLVGRGESSV